ncbi:MAG TPA: DUF5916 domain-containing protein [Gemmatimonadales bacterium]|nr:DUF5916 domain-containing protein [Gemmatimonadales bacterium]
MLPLLLQLALTPPAPRPVYSGWARELRVATPRFNSTIRVDGELDEPVWSQAAILTGFSEYQPVDGRPAEDSTEVLVWYAPDAIYFGIRAFERHGPDVIRATLAQRDNISNDDNVEILLDTYNDHRRALLFAVNPLGVQQDGVRTEGQDAMAGGASAGGRFDGVVDVNPDYVYESKGHLTPWGYQVEVRIPFKSLRYQSADPQTWALQIIRQVQHSGYQDTWSPTVRANASFLIQAGQLEGLTELHSGLVMDVTPEFTTQIPGEQTAGGWDYTATPQLGATVRWGITQNLGLNATANPDFSQVEADVAQVTVNQRFALFYPEKRPFFLDGLENFNTPNRLIYTRQIVQPDGAAKLVGKIGNTNVAYIGAVDQPLPADGLPTDSLNPIFSMLRLRNDLGASSTVGLLLTDWLAGSFYNHVAGVDSRVIWRKIWFSSLQVAGAWTRDASGTPRFGPLWDLTLFDRTGRDYGNHAEISGISPDFSTRSGFVPRTNVVSGNLFNRRSWYGQPGATIEQFQTYLMISEAWHYTDLFSPSFHLAGGLEGSVSDQLYMTLRGGWQLAGKFGVSHQRFDQSAYASYAIDRGVDTVAYGVPNGLYGLWSGSAGVTSPARSLQVAVTAAYGATPVFDEGSEGRETDLNLSLTWRPTVSLRFEGLWTHARITRASDGSRFSLANIPRLKVEYQLTRAIFVRYVGQYLAQERDALQDPRAGFPVLSPDSAGTLVPVAASTENTFRNDVLFSYNPIPGTVVFLGYGASLTEPDAFQFANMARTQDGFFLKVSYLFRL